MSKKVTPEKALEFVMFVTKICNCLPPPADAKRSDKIWYEIRWWFGLCYSLSLVTAIMYDIYLHRHDFNNTLLAMIELSPLSMVPWKMYICKRNGQELLACFGEAKDFIRTASVREREVLQAYVDRSIVFYYLMVGCVACTIVGFSSRPMYLPQKYMGHTSYPFEVGPRMVNVIRAMQVVGIIQTGLCVFIDFGTSGLVWLTVARYDLLAEKLQEVSDVKQCCMCIKEHQEILEFAERVRSISSMIAYAIVFTTMVGTIVGAIQFLTEVSTIAKTQYVTFEMIAILQLLGYCWPAENLLTESEGIGFAIYNSEWIGKPPELTRLMLIMMQRATKPSTISKGTFLPRFSLDLYKSFLSSSFSYFTTLRAVTTTSGPT